MRQRVAIIGAGPTGLGAAWRLTQTSCDIEVFIFDRAARAGGMHQSFERLGHVFDTGEFIYRRRPCEVSLPALFPALFAPVATLNPRVLFRGKRHQFPLPPSAILAAMPPLQRALFVPHFLLYRIYAALSSRRPATLKDWLVSLLGRWGYERSGLNDYVPKVLGLKAEEVDLAFAEKRLQSLNVSLSWRGLRSRLRNHLATRLGRTMPSRQRRDLALYPMKGGAGAVTQHMAEMLAARGVKFHLSCTVRRIAKDAAGYKIDTDIGALHFDHIVSTLPVQMLARICELAENTPRLTFRRLLMVYLVVARPRALEDSAILYSFEPHHLWKRATSYSALRPVAASRAETALGIEITLPETSAPQAISYYVENVIAALADEYGFFQRHEIRHIETMIFGGAYPVFYTGYGEHLARLRKTIEAAGLLSAGVGGAFDNIDSHDCIEAGFFAAEEVLKRVGLPTERAELAAAQ